MSDTNQPRQVELWTPPSQKSDAETEAALRLTNFFPKRTAKPDFVVAVKMILSHYGGDVRILQRVLDPVSGYACTYDELTLAKLKRYCEKQKEDLEIKDRRAPKSAKVMLDDEQTIEALLDRMNHNIDLPKIESANGWRLLRQAQKRFLAQSGRFNAYQFASFCKQRNMGYLPWDTPKPDYDTQMASAIRAGKVAETAHSAHLESIDNDLKSFWDGVS